jgi:hypothetical protein
MGAFAWMAIVLLAGTNTAAAPHRGKDPNDIICKELPMSGSMLDQKRVCMTRLQWEDRQRDTRETIERAQTQQVNGH